MVNGKLVANGKQSSCVACALSQASGRVGGVGVGHRVRDGGGGRGHRRPQSSGGDWPQLSRLLSGCRGLRERKCVCVCVATMRANKSDENKAPSEQSRDWAVKYFRDCQKLLEGSHLP
jgi:hypothetical protein